MLPLAAEELALDQVGRECRTVHRHELAVAAPASLVNGSRYKPLPGARFSQQQDRGIGRGDLSDSKQHIRQGSTDTYEVWRFTGSGLRCRGDMYAGIGAHQSFSFAGSQQHSSPKLAAAGVCSNLPALPLYASVLKSLTAIIHVRLPSGTVLHLSVEGHAVASAPAEAAWGYGERTRKSGGVRVTGACMDGS